MGSGSPPAQARPPPPPVHQGQYDPKALFAAVKVFVLMIASGYFRVLVCEERKEGLRALQTGHVP
jgi:hypothetical protein